MLDRMVLSLIILISLSACVYTPDTNGYLPIPEKYIGQWEEVTPYPEEPHSKISIARTPTGGMIQYSRDSTKNDKRVLWQTTLKIFDIYQNRIFAVGEEKVFMEDSSQLNSPLYYYYALELSQKRTSKASIKKPSTKGKHSSSNKMCLDIILIKTTITNPLRNKPIIIPKQIFGQMTDVTGSK